LLGGEEVCLSPGLAAFTLFHVALSLLGILSTIALSIAIYARYSRNLAGSWRRGYVITAALSVYFNVFVLIVQLFEKVPALKAAAPTQSEPPFNINQLTTLPVFVLLGYLGARNFLHEQLSAT
jgi:hypothetical protein